MVTVGNQEFAKRKYKALTSSELSSRTAKELLETSKQQTNDAA
jgi:hypothetical protein